MAASPIGLGKAVPSILQRHTCDLSVFIVAEFVADPSAEGVHLGEPGLLGVVGLSLGPSRTLDADRVHSQAGGDRFRKWNRGQQKGSSVKSQQTYFVSCKIRYDIMKLCGTSKNV